MVGTQTGQEKIFLIDFGLSKRFRYGKTGFHIPYSDLRSLVGTARFSSINTHIGIEQSRRDDLEAISYMLIYFLKGELPWQGIQKRTRSEKYSGIMDIKIKTPCNLLCEGLKSKFFIKSTCRGIRNFLKVLQGSQI